MLVPTGNSTEPWLAVGRSGKMCVCAWVHTNRILARISLCRKEALQLAGGTGHGMTQGRLRVASDLSVQCRGTQWKKQGILRESKEEAWFGVFFKCPKCPGRARLKKTNQNASMVIEE